MKLAVSTFDLRHESPEDVAQLVSEVAIDNLEIYGAPPPSQHASYAQWLKRCGAKVACINATSKYRVLVNSPSEVQRVIESAINFAALLGARFVNLYPGYQRELDVFANIRLFRQRIKPLLADARANDVTLLLENYYDPVQYGDDPRGEHFMRRPEATLALVELVDDPALAVTWDPCNHYLASIEPWPYAYKVLQPVIRYVHVKSATRYSPLWHSARWSKSRVNDSSTGSYLHVTLEEGAVNWDGILRQLVQDRFDGFVTLEPHAADGKGFVDAVRRNVAFIEARVHAVV